MHAHTILPPSRAVWLGLVIERPRRGNYFLLLKSGLLREMTVQFKEWLLLKQRLCSSWMCSRLFPELPQAGGERVYISKSFRQKPFVYTNPNYSRATSEWAVECSIGNHCSFLYFHLQSHFQKCWVLCKIQSFANPRNLYFTLNRTENIVNVF